MPKTAQRGNTLLMILMGSAILSTVLVGFVSFFRSMNKAQGNLEKAGLAADLEMNARALIGNTAACLRSVTPVVTANQVNRDVPAALLDSNGTAILQTGTRVNGIVVRTLTARLFPLNGGVHLVRFDITVDKSGPANEVMGRGTYNYTYFANAVMNGANVERCLLSDGQGRLSIVDIEPFTVPVSGSGAARLMMTVGYTGPNPWGASGAEIHPANPPIDCVAGVNCPFVDSPVTTIRAKGNLLGLTVTSFIERGSFDTTQSIAYAGALVLYVARGATPVSIIQVGASSGGTGTPGHLSLSMSAPTTLINVAINQTYRIFTRLYVTRTGGSATPSFFVSSSGAVGSVTHYLRTP